MFLINFLKICLFTYSLSIVSVQAETLLNQVAVKVNGSAITRQEVLEAVQLIKRYQPATENIPSNAEIVKSLIIDELMLQLANNSGPINHQQLDQLIIQLIREGNVPPELSHQPEQLKKQLIVQNFQQQLAQQALVHTTEEEVLEQLQQLPSEMPSLKPAYYHLERLKIPFLQSSRHSWCSLLKRIKSWFIVSKTTQKYENASTKTLPNNLSDITAQIKQGATFKELCETQQSSSQIDELSGQLKDIPVLYQSALTELGVSEIAGPFKVGKEFHIIRLKKVEGPTFAKISHILLSDSKAMDGQNKQRLTEIRADCIAGKADFSEHAKQYSEDPNTVFKGGELGWVLPGTLGEVFDQQIALLAPGAVSQPFKTTQGWHLIKMHQKQFLTSEHPKWKHAIATAYLQQRKMLEAIESVRNQLYESALIEWVVPADSIVS